MTHKQDNEPSDELFFEQLKDQFVFFYALSITLMESYKKARAQYQADAARSAQADHIEPK